MSISNLQINNRYSVISHHQLSAAGWVALKSCEICYASRCTTKTKAYSSLTRMVLWITTNAREISKCNEKRKGPHTILNNKEKQILKYINIYYKNLYCASHPVYHYHPSNTFTTKIGQGDFLNRTDVIWGARRQNLHVMHISQNWLP